MVVPGRVENLNVIFDLKGLGISQVPVHALSEVYSVMSHHYIGRVFRFYVANMPFALRALSSVAMAILTDRQRQKLTLLDNVSKLKQDFAPHQLEKDLGGSRPIFTEYFPFPLQAGPFAPEAKGGPDSAAVPNVHRALTAAGARGSLWDPRRSAEENVALGYSQEAADIFRRCGLEVPAEAELSEAEQRRPSVSSEKIASRFGTPRHTRSGEIRIDNVDDEEATDIPETEKRPSSEASTEASTACDASVGSAEAEDNAETTAPSPRELRARAARLLRGTVRRESALHDALSAVRPQGQHPKEVDIFEEDAGVSQLCQATGFFGIPSCWLQPAR